MGMETVARHVVNEELVVWNYVWYLAISIGLTIWVAQTLFKNGRVFLLDTFQGRAEMADSVNKLLLVGFYLINVGYVAMTLKNGDLPGSIREGFEFVSTKVGLVLFVLGGMHFMNLVILSRMRSSAMDRYALPPVSPDSYPVAS